MAAKPIAIAILANASQAKREMKSFSGSVSSLGKNVVKGLALAGGAAAAFTASSVKLAVDAQQNLGGAEAVFGKYADTIKKTGAQAYKQLGLSQSDYLSTANKMGSLFQGSGIKVQKSMELTTKAMQRAGDVASVMGIDTSAAMEAIAGAAKGNFTMMDNLGVAMNVANLEAYALEKGMNFKWKTASQAEKTELAMKMFFDRTSKYAGNFEKESKSTFSGAMGAFRAQIQNLMAAVGMKLLPVLTRIISFLSTRLMPAVVKFGDTAKQRLVPVFEAIADAGRDMLTKLEPVAGWFRKNPGVIKGIAIALGIAAGAAALFALSMGAVAVVTSPITAIVLSVAALGAAIGYAWTHSETFRTTVTGLGRDLLGIGQQVLPMLQSAWATFGGFLTGFVTNTFRNVMTVIKGALDVIRGITKTVLAVLRGDWKGAWNGIKQILSGVLGIIKGLVSQGMNTLKTLVSVAWAAVKGLTSAAWNGIKSAVSRGVQSVVNTVKAMPGKIKGFFSGAGEWLKEAGKDIVRGLGAGLDAMWSWVEGKIKALTDKIPGWVKKKLGISSPSKVMRKLAIWIPIGIARGIDDGAKGIDKSLAKITKRIKNAIKGKNATQRENRILKSLRDEYRSLEKLGKKHDQITKKIVDARKALDAAKKAAKEYALSIRDSLLSAANITSLDEGHMGDPTAILNQLKDRVARATRFAELIEQLPGKLNETSLNQLIAAGVDGGLAAAEALAAGGSSMVAEVNSLMAELAKTGQTLGTNLAEQFHGAGIQAAQGLLNGLLKDEKKLEKAAKKLAKILANAVKKALGIKSPSTVFAGLGKNTAEGLVIGLDSVRIERAGRVLAKDLVRGFGEPRLSAVSEWNSRAANGQQSIDVRVHLTGDAQNQISRGKQLVQDITAYQRAGGAA